MEVARGLPPPQGGIERIFLAPLKPAIRAWAEAAPTGASVHVHQEYSPAAAGLETNALVALVHLQGDEALRDAQNPLPVTPPKRYPDIQTSARQRCCGDADPPFQPTFYRYIHLNDKELAWPPT